MGKTPLGSVDDTSNILHIAINESVKPPGANVLVFNKEQVDNITSPFSVSTYKNFLRASLDVNTFQVSTKKKLSELAEEIKEKFSGEIVSDINHQLTELRISNKIGFMKEYGDEKDTIFTCQSVPEIEDIHIPGVYSKVAEEFMIDLLSEEWTSIDLLLAKHDLSEEKYKEKLIARVKELLERPDSIRLHEVVYINICVLLNNRLFDTDLGASLGNALNLLSDQT